MTLPGEAEVRHLFLTTSAFVVSLFAMVSLTAVPIVSQTPNALYAPPRTPDGQPDLEGVWTNVTVTPLVRPAEFAGKEFLSEKEAAEYEEQTLLRLIRQFPAEERAGNPELRENDQGKVIPSRRTSLIVDPPDGRIPPRTVEAQKRAALRAPAGPADGPENLTLTARCLWWENAGPPMLPTVGGNNNYQILQGPGYVAILVEQIHDARVIPLDGRPHLAPNVRQWLGDSLGHWEGDTLVVDTTNFSDQTRFRGSGENLHVVERFTRTGPDTIRYEFTVDDPETFTMPWKGEIPMNRIESPIFEYACNEGNYGLTGILAGAREEEMRAAEEAAKNGLK